MGIKHIEGRSAGDPEMTSLQMSITGIDLENPRNIGHLNYLRINCAADRLGTTKFTNFAKNPYAHDCVGFVQWEQEEEGWALGMAVGRECKVAGNSDTWVGEPDTKYTEGAGRYTFEHFQETYPELIKLLAGMDKEQAVVEALEKLNNLLPRIRTETTAWPVALAVVTPVTASDKRCYLMCSLQSLRIAEGFDEVLYPNGMVNPLAVKVFF